MDTGHSLVADYTAMTRGRAGNTAYLITDQPPDEHDPQRRREDARAVLARRLGEHGPEPTATMVGRDGEAHTRSLAWIGGQWDQVQHTHGHPRYEALLAERVAARHGEQVAADMAGEPGYPRLIRAVYSAELGGHQPEALLDDVTAGGLADADSLADVLRYRIHRALADGREPEQQSEAGDWTTLAAPLDGSAGQWAHQLARAASERQAELGKAAAIDQPAWTAALGPVPDAVEDPAARAVWEARAGIEAGYRDLAGVPDEQISLGAPPSLERPLEHAMYHHAAHTRGYQSDPEAGDMRVLSNAELYAVRERWTREQAWAPAYVADELSAAYQAAAGAGQDADLTAARLAQLTPDAEGREWVAAQHTISARDAEAGLERAHQLEEVHQARAGWAQATAPAEATDRDAALELERRGLPLQRAAEPEPEQLGLFTEPARQAGTAALAATTTLDEPRQTPASATPASGPADDAEVAAAQHARADAAAGFHRDLEARHQAGLAEMDPEQRLDPAAREAALHADNLARAVEAIRAEQGARLDPHGELDDDTLTHRRAAELAEQREAAEPQRATARAEAHREIDPDGRLSDDARDAVRWQRAHDRAATVETRDHTRPAATEAPRAEAPEQQEEPQRSRQPDRTEQPGAERTKHETRDRGEAVDRDEKEQLTLLDVTPSPAAAQDARRSPVDRSPADRDHRIIEAARDGDDTVRAEDDVWRPEQRHHRDERSAVASGGDRDAGRDAADQAVTLAEARRQAQAADGQRAAREAAALERGTQQQATAATGTEDTDRTRRDTTLSDPAQQPRQADATATPSAAQPEAPRMVRTPGPQQ